MLIPSGLVISSFLHDLPDFEFEATESLRVTIDLYTYPDTGGVRRTVYDQLLTPVSGLVTVADTPSLLLPFMDYSAGAEYLFSKQMLLQINLGDPAAFHALVYVHYASASVVPPSQFKEGEIAPAAYSFTPYIKSLLLAQSPVRTILPDNRADIYWIPDANDETFTFEALLAGRTFTASLPVSVPFDGNAHSIDASPRAVLSLIREQNALSLLYTVDYLASYRVSASRRTNAVTYRILRDTNAVAVRFLYRGLFGLLEELPVPGVAIRRTAYDRDIASSSRRLVASGLRRTVTYEVSTALIAPGEAQAYRSLFASPAVWLRSADPRLDMQEVLHEEITCEESSAPDRLLSYKFTYRLCDTAEKALDI